MASPSLRKPGHMYTALKGYSADEVLHTLNTSAQRVTQERIRNTLQKYLPVAVAMQGASEAEILQKLNEKPKKPENDSSL